MVSREGYELLEEGIQPCSPNGLVATADKTEIPGLFQENDDSSGSISIPGFWSESKSEDEDCPWLTESCSAVLEPSKDESRDSVGNPKDLPGDFFTLSLPELATDEESLLSKDEPTNPEDAHQSNSERHPSNEQLSSSERLKGDEKQSRSELNNSNEQQSNKEHHKSKEQQSSMGQNNSNEQQSNKEHHKSNEQQSSSECHDNNEQQNSNEQNRGNEQQSSSECHDNHEQQNSNEQNNSNDQQDSNEQHDSNELPNSNEHQNINEQQGNSEPHNNNEVQTDEPNGNCYATFLDCYNVNCRKIKDSRFIYIFQLFVSLLSVSEIVMGIIFYGSCDPQPSPIPVSAILMAISGLVLVYNWLIKVRRQRRGEYYWNYQRNILSASLAIFLFLLTLEVAFFTKASPKTVQSKVEIKCVKAYYDYLYYMFFAIGGSLALAASLYFPDCCIFTFTYQAAPVPSDTNGHYQPL